jgi:hypothetical protein
MKLALERHAYAPELNKAHLLHRGRIVASLPAPGCDSIKAARAALFAPAHKGRKVSVSFTRPAPWQGLNWHGAALYPLGGEGLRSALDHVRQIAARKAGGVLDSGDILPDPARRVVTSMKG